MGPCIRITDQVSVCGVLISSRSMFSKTAFTVIQAFSYEFSTEKDFVWELFDLLLTPRAICHGYQIVYSVPQNAETNYPKNKPVWAM